MQPPNTPDGRYLVVRGRLWRCTNPGLGAELHAALVSELMAARRAVRAALQTGHMGELASARAAVNSAKVVLGERGPVWWTDGAEDFNRHLVKNTPYSHWYAEFVAMQHPQRRALTSSTSETAALEPDQAPCPDATAPVTLAPDLHKATGRRLNLVT